MEREIMASAVVDIDINEGDTFVMTLDLWENQDRTIPVDVSGDTFTGNMKFGKKIVPFIVVKSPFAVNVITVTTDYKKMVDLGRQGSYELDQLTGGESYRLIQGRTLVNQEVSV